MEPLYSTCTVIRECGISVRQLYYWESIELIQPRYESFGTRRFRRYTTDDVNVLKQVKALLEAGFTLQAVKDMLRGLAPFESKGAWPLLGKML